MWSDRRILDLFGIEHPIVLAPMAGATNPDLVAKVCESGGLGSFGAAGTPPEKLREVVRAIRARTDLPFNVNLFSRSTEDFDQSARPGRGLNRVLEALHNECGLGEVPEPEPMFGPADDQLTVLIEEGVPVISFHFGADPEVIARAHDASAIVLCSATTVDEAIILADAGVDAVIAQGQEAGGHRGTFNAPWTEALIGTTALVPQVVDAVSVPVIAAGGIMDARGLVASLALGASAVQMGTAFLACPEAKISEAWKNSLLNADATQSTVTEVLSGKPARGLRNRYVNAVEALDETLLPYPAQFSVSRALRRHASDSDDPDFMALWAGQGVGMIQSQPASKLMRTLVCDSQHIIKRLAEG